MKTKISILLVVIMLISLFCSACKPCDGHVWNNGELTKAPTVSRDGKITYTCVKCEKKKREKVSAGTELVTRGELEQAVVESAWAYYMKGEKLQYDSTILTKVSHFFGGIIRHTNEVAPEYGTSHTNIYSVCTAYTTNAYLDALGRDLWEKKNFGPNGVTTFFMWSCAENQPEESYKHGDIDPITENDSDTAIVRWMNDKEYRKDSKSTAHFTDEFGVYNSDAFTGWHKSKKYEFKKDETTGYYEYYLKGKQLAPADAKVEVANYLFEQKKGEYVNLRPGDITVYDGHALIYIGKGKVLDCYGKKYIIDSGLDQVEERGAIYGRMSPVESTLEKATNTYVVVRPLDYYAKDYDGKPENDIIKYKGENIETTEKVLTRQQYPAMDIDRTVNITPYGTASANEEITYSVKITNNTTEDKYMAWRGNGYNGQEYKELMVTEIIPTGTEFVSATGNPEQVDGKLSWNVNIPAGQSVELTYTVKVTAQIGSVITNDGGFVGNIPSNSISNRVGGKKLDAVQLEKLDEVTKEQDLSSYGEGLDFAKNVYKKMGITLELPSIEDIIKNLFTPTTYEKFDRISLINYTADGDVLNGPIVMYTPQKTVSAEYASIKNMLIDGYYGGYRCFDFDVEKLAENGFKNVDYNKEMNISIIEFRPEYLEPGDIIIFASAKNTGDADLNEEISSYGVIVCVGNGTIVMHHPNGHYVLSGIDAKEQLTSVYRIDWDIFFALRPSQAN